MPHCILEYTDNIVDTPDWKGLLGQLHEALVSTGQFKMKDIKSRVIKHEHFLMGKGDANQAFVTLNVQILDGRTAEVKTEVSKAVFEPLVKAFPETAKKNIFSLTVQVTDIHRASYQKHANY